MIIQVIAFGVFFRSIYIINKEEQLIRKIETCLECFEVEVQLLFENSKKGMTCKGVKHYHLFIDKYF